MQESLSAEDSARFIERLFPRPDADGELAALCAAIPCKPERREHLDLYMLGLALWSVFSDNHQVTTREGLEVDLGTWRGTGHFLADWVNEISGSSTFDYLDFYMGVGRNWEEESAAPLFELVFRRLRTLEADWRYSSPRIYDVDVTGVPAAELLASLDGDVRERVWKRAESDEDARRLRKELDAQAERRALAAALRDPPTIVRGYRQVYGCWPAGWPPVRVPG